MEQSPYVKIVVYVPESHADIVRDAMKAVHPYEEIAFDVYPVEVN